MAASSAVVPSPFWDYFGALDEHEKQLNYASHQHHIMADSDADDAHPSIADATAAAAATLPAPSSSTTPPAHHLTTSSAVAAAAVSSSASSQSNVFLSSFTRRRPLFRFFEHCVIIFILLYTGFYMCGTVRDIGLQHIDQCYTHGSHKMAAGVQVTKKNAISSSSSSTTAAQTISITFEDMPWTSRLIKSVFFDSGCIAAVVWVIGGGRSGEALTTSSTGAAAAAELSGNSDKRSHTDAFTFIGYDDWDPQWRSFNENIPLLTIGLSVYVLISRWLYSRFNKYADYVSVDNTKRNSHHLHLYGLLILNVGFVLYVQSTGAIFTLGIAFLNYKAAQAVINWVDRKNVHYHSHNNKKTSASTSQPPPPPALINLALAQVVSIVLHVGFLVVVRKYGGLSFVDLIGKRIAFAESSGVFSFNPFDITFWQELDSHANHAMMHWHSSYALVMLKMLAYNYDMWYCFNYFRHHQYQKIQPSTQKSTQLKPGERKPYTMSNYANDAECKKIFLDHYTTFMGRAPATEAEEQRCHDIYVSIIAESRLHENVESSTILEQRNEYPGIGKEEQQLFELMASSVDFWSLRRRTECPRFNNKFARPAGADDEGADDYGLKQYVLFCCYLPLFIAGPAMGYNAFVSQCLYRPQKTYFFNFSKQMAALRTRFGRSLMRGNGNNNNLVVDKEKSSPLPYYSIDTDTLGFSRHKYLIVYATRITCIYIILLLFLHIVPMNCIRYNDEIFKSIGGNLESQVGQYYQVIWATLAFTWFKFTVIWRFFRFFSILDGVEVVEDMLSFHLNTRGVADFWRQWHHSFNAWIVRYIYVPSGGAKKKHLNVFPIFLFMALWHETELYMFMWAAVNCSFMVVELVADGWAKKIVNKFYMKMYFKRYAKEKSRSINPTAASSFGSGGEKIKITSLKDFVYSQNIWWWQYARSMWCGVMGASMFSSNMFGFATGNNSNRIITGAFFLPFYAEREVGTFEFVGFNPSGFLVAISPILYAGVCTAFSNTHKEHAERRQERDKWQLCQRFS